MTDKVSRLVRAGLLTGVTDGLFATVQSAVTPGATVIKLWQGVASTPFNVGGRRAVPYNKRCSRQALFGCGFAAMVVLCLQLN